MAKNVQTIGLDWLGGSYVDDNFYPDIDLF